LSGGQRSRIALARALYSDADIYILDDPFSALDSRVSKNLVDVCFLDLLKYKTVILVTHHVSLLQKFHNANVSYYILSEGTLLKQSFSAEKREENKEELLILQTQVSKIEESNPSNGENKLVEEENREIGGIEMNVLYGYVSKVGIFTFLVVMISILLMQASKNVNDLWTSHWVNDMDKSVGDAYFDLIVLAILSGANSIFTLVRSFIFAYGGLKASKSTFTELLDNVLEAPVQFFEVNPLGRILNRFSADTYSIDDQLPFMTNIFFAQLFSIIGSIAVILYAQWYLIILLVPLLVFYLKIQEKYRTCSRELKRLDSVSNSPLFSNFSEVLDGV
jgi:ATP-binding cassette subfamily C (CFTR/MRP) protein 10